MSSFRYIVADGVLRLFDTFINSFNLGTPRVTDDLDEGPIISQDVIPINHKHSVNDLVQLGREIEKNVLYKAVKAHLENRIIVYNNKTIIFS